MFVLLIIAQKKNNATATTTTAVTAQVTQAEVNQLEVSGDYAFTDEVIVRKLRLFRYFQIFPGIDRNLKWKIM